MGFGCPICGENLESLPAEAQARGRRGSGTVKELNISATPCGHIFHAYCIQKWLSGNLASSKLCPCCRKIVPQRCCLSLFPTTFEEESVTGPCNHEETIAIMKRQFDKMEKWRASEAKEKDRLYEALSSDYKILSESHRKEKVAMSREIDTWMNLAKKYESYKDNVNELEQRAKRAEFQLTTYSQLDKLIKGVEAKVKNDPMINAPLTKETVRNLLKMKHVLAAELKKKEKSCTELRDNNERTQQRNRKLKSMYDKKANALEELKQIYEISKMNGRAGNTSLAPFRTKKRRFQEPLSKTKPGMTPMVTGPNYAEDSFQSSVKFKKMAPMKASSLSSTVYRDDNKANELRIRGNVPGIPLPKSATRFENLQNQSANSDSRLKKRYVAPSFNPDLELKKRIFKKDVRPEKRKLAF